MCNTFNRKTTACYRCDHRTVYHPGNTGKKQFSCLARKFGAFDSFGEMDKGNAAFLEIELLISE